MGACCGTLAATVGKESSLSTEGAELEGCRESLCDREANREESRDRHRERRSHESMVCLGSTLEIFGYTNQYLCVVKAVCIGHPKQCGTRQKFNYNEW